MRFASGFLTILLLILSCVACMGAQQSDANAAVSRAQAAMYLGRAQLEFRAGKREDALRDVQKSIRLNPAQRQAMSLLAQIMSEGAKTPIEPPSQSEPEISDEARTTCERAKNLAMLHVLEPALKDSATACSMGDKACCELAQTLRAQLTAPAAKPNPPASAPPLDTNPTSSAPASDEDSNRSTKEGFMAGFMGFLFVVFLLFCIGTFFSGLFTVPTARAAIVQRFGRFVRVAGAGLNFKVPWIEQVVAKVDLRVQQLDVKMETKTKDNVFVAIPVSIQYHVLPDRVYEAYYKLSDPRGQIGSYVFNVILGHVPKMHLDEAFEQQNEIATAVKQELDGVMAGFGYGIVKALVTDIVPDPKVKAAMNDINAARREQEAANARGEAEKILKVKQAEAEALSKQLQGQGIANERKAIIDGLRESVETFKAGVEGASAQDVMMLVLLTQYFDTLKEIGASARSNTIMMPHSPGAMEEFFNQIRNAVTLGDVAGAAQRNTIDPPRHTK